VSKRHHLPSGHFSEAIRSFACVEHPHLRQRPVTARELERFIVVMAYAD
jgi:hypothetical protein